MIWSWRYAKSRHNNSTGAHSHYERPIQKYRRQGRRLRNPVVIDLHQITILRTVLDFNGCIIMSNFEGWSTILTRKPGHPYIKWDADMLCTEQGFKQILLHIMYLHQNLQQCFVVLILIVSHQKFKIKLEHNYKHYNVCQHKANDPRRFRESMQHHDCMFTHVIRVDLMYIDGRDVLHTVYTDTYYSVTCINNGESTKNIPSAMKNVWLHPYIACLRYPCSWPSFSK